MRVLQLHTRYRGRGGEDTTVEIEAALLQDTGHEVRLFEAHNAGGAAGAAGQLLRSPWNTAAAGAVTEEIASFRPDVVHIHNTWFALSLAVAAAARRQRVPVVMTVQNYRLVCISANLFRDGQLCEDCVGHGPWRGVLHRCYHDSALVSGALATNIAVHRRARTWQREVDVLIAVSEFGVERHIAGGVPRDKIVVKDNFAHDPGPRSREPSESDRVLFVGRPAPEKGLELLLEAWLQARPANLQLDVIGGEVARVAGSGTGINLLGQLPAAEVAERMLRARALVIPSQWPEGQPLVILEALASGLPVVGTAIGGIEEVLRDDPQARRVPLGDRDGWAQALSELVSDDLVDRRGLSSRSLYEHRFTPEIALENLLGAYELAQRRSGQARSAST